MLSNRDLVLKLTEGNAKRMTRQNNWEEPKQEVGNPFHKTREDFKRMFMTSRWLIKPIVLKNFRRFMKTGKQQANEARCD